MATKTKAGKSDGFCGHPENAEALARVMASGHAWKSIDSAPKDGRLSGDTLCQQCYGSKRKLA